MQSNLYIILARPFTADNIGAVARSMKNMGFSNLRLISPRPRWRLRAKRLARSASNILDHAEIYTNSRDAVADLECVIGTTARTGNHRGHFLDFDDVIKRTQRNLPNQKIGIMFGRESKGLNNEETDVCDTLMSIPSHSSYASLNLAQAVMVTLFSIAKDGLKKHVKKPFEVRSARPVTKAEAEKALKHFEKALKSLRFSEGPDGRVVRIGKLMESVFKRAGMLDRDANMIMGVSRKICDRMAESDHAEKL